MKNKIVITLMIALILCTCLAFTVSADYFEINENDSSHLIVTNNYNYHWAGYDDNVVYFVGFYVNGSDELGYFRFSKYVAETLIDQYYTLHNGGYIPISSTGVDIGAIMYDFETGLIEGPTLDIYMSDYPPEYNPPYYMDISLYDFWDSYRNSDEFYNFGMAVRDCLVAWNKSTYVLDGYQFEVGQLQNQNSSLQNEISTLENRVAELTEQVRESYNDGKQDGLQEGYTNGMNEANALENGLITVMNAPFYILKGIFNFEIFGINILSIILSILTLIIVGFFVKLII